MGSFSSPPLQCYNRSMLKLNKAHHPEHHPKHHTTTPRQKVWVICFVVLAAVLLGGVVFLSMGKSKIAFTWTPQSVQASTTFTASANPGDQDVTAAFVSTSVDVTDSFTAETQPAPVTPPATTPTFTGKARGNVTISNHYSKAQPLIAGTRLKSPDGQIFRTQARVDVPVGGSVTTEVVADVAGQQGALPQGTTFTLPALWAGLQDKITGVSTEAFHGETTSTVTTTTGPGLTATELANAQTKVVTDAITKALPDLQKLVPSGRTLHTGMTVTSVTKRSGPSIGDKVSTYSLTDTVKVTGIAIDDAKVLTLAQAALTPVLGPNLQLLDLDATTFMYTLATSDLTKQTASVTLAASGKTMPTPTHSLLLQATYAGKSASDVRTLLAEEKAVSNVSIQLSPFWITHVPSSKNSLELGITRAQ